MQDSYKVEGPACKSVKTQGLLKEIGLAEPWISDPTAEGAVDRAVVAVHESTVDRPLKRERVRDPVHPSQITRPRTCASEVATASAPETGAARRCLAGSSPAHPRSLHRAPFCARRALRVVGGNASTPRRSGGRRGHPQRPVPEGGGAAAPAS
jgi:hypothetical protein